MKSFKQDIVKMLLVMAITTGLFLAYFNVLNAKFLGNENRRKIHAVTDKILQYPNQAKRMQCDSVIYLMKEDQSLKDDGWSMQFIHDFEHKKMQVSQGIAKEIFEYGGEEFYVYSKGISPVYMKETVELRKVPMDRWFKYSCEPMYGSQSEGGINGRISYGFLESEDYLIKIKMLGKEEIDGKEYEKYTAVIRNTCQMQTDAEGSDNEFRIAVAANGLDAMELRKRYPDVYSMLKGVYEKDTEELSVWLDEEGKLTFIEKDYTFSYYMSMMKENSEKIRDRVGKYGYPKVICRQTYKYDPHCQNIALPKEFEEL